MLSKPYKNCRQQLCIKLSKTENNAFESLVLHTMLFPSFFRSSVPSPPPSLPTHPQEIGKKLFYHPCQWHIKQGTINCYINYAVFALNGYTLQNYVFWFGLLITKILNLQEHQKRLGLLSFSLLWEERRSPKLLQYSIWKQEGPHPLLPTSQSWEKRCRSRDSGVWMELKATAESLLLPCFSSFCTASTWD